MAASLPLLRLPKDALENVLRIMEPIQQCNFSLCSRVTKNLVKNLKIQIDELTLYFNNHDSFIRINFADDLRVGIKFESGYFHPTVNVAYVDAFYEGRIRARADRTRYQWDMPRYPIRGWLVHFTDVFGHSKLDVLNVSSSMLGMDLIVESVRGLDINCLRMLDAVNHEFGGELMNRLQRTINLEVNTISELGMSVIQKHSYDRLHFYDAAIDIDNLLLTTCANLSVKEMFLNEEYLNRFLKVWMRGCMNPNLKKVHLWVDLVPGRPYFDDTLTMAGVKYKQNVERKVFPKVWNQVRQRFYPEKIVEGGFNVTNKDGIMATVVLTREDGNEERESHFRMFVWDN